MKTIVLFERGILGWETLFGEWKQWPNQAVAWVNKKTEFKAQTLTYFCGAVLAAATRTFRAKQFCKLLHQYRNECRIIMVCHSEGTATGLRALQLSNWPRIEELHLICGAADSDCDRNGLNKAVLSGKIGKVFVYVAGKDKAMKLEDTYIGSLCFGLQTKGTPLGLDGPKNVIPNASRNIEVIRWKEFGHSTCFESEHFENTMKEIIGQNSH